MEETKFNVLIIDDEKSIRLALQRLLLNENFNLFICEDVDECISMVKQKEIALIIADYLMPKKNGLELLTEINNISPDTIKILLTALNEANIAIEAINNVGLYRYILKPWNAKEFKLIIKEALQKYNYIKINKKLLEFTRLQNKALIEKTKEIEFKNKVLKKLYEDTNLNFLKSIQIFTSLLEIFDSYLMNHCKRVSVMCRVVAERMRLTENEIKTIEFSALLHDIGLIAMPRSLIKKRFTLLSKNEQEMMKQHTIVGQNLVCNDQHFEEVGKIIRYHHEKLNGEGFPEGLSGKNIPLGSRLIAVVDAYDALVNPPSIFERSSEQSVKGFLYTNKGTRFDSEIVDAFLFYLDETTSKPAQIDLNQKKSSPAIKNENDYLII